MIHNARSVQILLAFTGDSLTADRGKLFFKVITTVSRFLSHNGIENLDKFLVPLLLQPLSPPQRNMGELVKWEKFIAKKMSYVNELM